MSKQRMRVRIGNTLQVKAIVCQAQGADGFEIRGSMDDNLVKIFDGDVEVYSAMKKDEVSDKWIARCNPDYFDGID